MSGGLYIHIPPDIKGIAPIQILFKMCKMKFRISNIFVFFFIIIICNFGFRAEQFMRRQDCIPFKERLEIIYRSS